MPAGLPGSTAAQNAANPSLGATVIFDLLSGPKGSPFDKAGSAVASTGGLSTGIGFGASVGPINPVAPASIKAAGFTDDYQPGISKPDATASPNSTLMYIGGGKTAIVAGTGANGNGAPANWKVASPVPYVAGFGIGGAGNGGSRDAGAGPAFTGFTLKTVTAAAGVAIGAAVEAGWLNRAPRALVVGESVFGSNAAASAVVA